MKKALIFPLFIMLLCITAIPVSADAPAPIPTNIFYCNVQNAPVEAVYFDILIQITPQDDEYLSFSKRETTISADSEIALYNKDGYMSLSFHYKNLEVADMKIASPCFRLKDPNLSIDQVSPTIKAVILDKDGNILQMSEAVSTKPGKSEFAYKFTYDAAENNPTLQFNDVSKNPPSIASVLLSLLLIKLVVSVAIGTLLANSFKLRPIWKIPVINAVIQIVFIILFMAILFGGVISAVTLIISEIFVYIAEYITYHLIFKSIPKRKIALFTLTSNAVSLIIFFLITAKKITG